MKASVRYRTLAVGLVVAMTVASASYARSHASSDQYGARSDGSSVDRVVTITPGTQWVNVDNGEVVKFVDQATGKAFTWSPNTSSNPLPFDLSRIAPAGALGGQRVLVYVDTPNNIGD